MTLSRKHYGSQHGNKRRNMYVALIQLSTCAKFSSHERQLRGDKLYYAQPVDLEEWPSSHLRSASNERVCLDTFESGINDGNFNRNEESKVKRPAAEARGKSAVSSPPALYQSATWWQRQTFRMLEKPREIQYNFIIAIVVMFIVITIIVKRCRHRKNLIY